VSVTTEQKVDFLLKKVGYTLSKTGSVTGTGAISGGTTKEPFAESLPSPLVVPDSSIWNQSLSIPTTPPGSDTAIVKVYSTSSALRMTADSSVSGSRAFIAYTTYNNTSSARLTDWIDTQFGTSYVLKVYKGDPNSSGTLLPAGGSGSNDGWFFDYSSGVLNFNGSGLPSGVTDTNIYIVGYRYIGSKGTSSPGQINPTNLYVSGISTFAGLVDINAGGQANTFKVEDLTSGRVVIAGTGGEIEDSGNLTFNGQTLNVVGHVESDTVNVSGMTSLAQAEVSDLAQNSVVYAGSSGRLKDSSNLKFTDTKSEFEVIGHSVLDTVVASGIVTAGQFSTGASGTGVNITTNSITGPAELFIDPAAVGDNTGKVRIKGDLFVDGTTFSVHNGDIEFGDFVVGIASTVPTNALLDGAGIGIGSTGIRKFIRYNHSASSLKSSEHLDVASGKVYKVNGTEVLSATTLGSGVVNSSLTSVGTLTGLTISGNTNLNGNITSNISVVSTDTGSSAGPEFKLFRNSASPADADYLGQIKFAGESDTGVERNYAKITGKILDASNGTEDGIIEIAHIKAGSQNISARFRSDSLQLINGTNLTVAGTAEVTGTATFTGNIDANGNLDVDGQTDLDVLNVAELATFTGNIDANGSLDVDGHTELDNLGVSGVSTFTSNIDANGNLDVDGQTDLDVLNVAELATFTGNIDANGSLDVDGHTELDNLGVSGVSTFAGNINANGNIVGDNSTNITGIAGVTASTLTGTLQTAAQPNVTSVGTLGSLVVSGQTVVGSGVTLNATGVIATGVITATSFTGSLTGNADTATLATRATDLAINGTNQLVYQASNNDSAILAVGNAGQVLQSNGSGSAPQWVTTAPSAIEGLSVKEEGSAVGTAGSITTLNFVGAGIVVDAAANAGVATVTASGGATTDDVVALAIALG